MRPDLPAPLVVSGVTAGLCNRIKGWVSAMRLGREARVHWPVGRSMPTPFSDLFTGEWEIRTIPPEATVYRSWRLAILPEDEAHLPAGFATAGAGAHPLVRGVAKAWWNLRGQPSDRYRFMIFPKSHSRRSTRADARHIDLEYERIPRYFRDVYGPLFARIVARPEIAQRVDAWARAHLDEGVIGLHVRSWRDDPRRRRKYHDRARHRLARLIESSRATDRFFVASDSDEVIAELDARLGPQRVLHFARQTLRDESQRSPESGVEDLIDLLLLSRCSRMYLSYLSTFGETAWWLGGTAARVEVY
jgi:hypothetical protein